MRITLPAFILLVIIGCRKEEEIPLPNTQWDLFMAQGTYRLDAGDRHRLGGHYTVTEGQGIFGEGAVLRWTWTRNGMDTAFHVSIFGARDRMLFVGEGRRTDSTCLLNGYWRRLGEGSSGQCRFILAPQDGSAAVFTSEEELGDSAFTLRGSYGHGQEVPWLPVTLRYERALPEEGAPLAIAHRGGGRNQDDLPASENSVELIRHAARYGARGVELDVRSTSDAVAVLYHDETLNDRLVRPCGLLGPIDAYNHAQLSGIVRLVNGERIPTVEEALHTVVHETDLRIVWLDMKDVRVMGAVRAAQARFMQEAQAAGRDVSILIGLPDEEARDAYLSLPDHVSAPALCELDLADALAASCAVWAPRWTLGLQSGEVASAHAAGMRCYVWTLDLPEYIRQFVGEGDFDGILSNYPCTVTYESFTRQ